VTAIVSGQKGDGQLVNMHVRVALRFHHWFLVIGGGSDID
jgi:hypothetical protein